MPSSNFSLPLDMILATIVFCMYLYCVNEWVNVLIYYRVKVITFDTLHGVLHVHDILHNLIVITDTLSPRSLWLCRHFDIIYNSLLNYFGYWTLNINHINMSCNINVIKIYKNTGY